MQIHPPGFSATCLHCCPAQPSLHPCPRPGQAREDEATLSSAGVWWCQARSTSPSSLWLPQLPGSRLSWRLPPLPYTPRLLLLSLSSPALKAASPSPILTTTQTTQPHVRVLRHADVNACICTIKATVRLRPGKRMRTHSQMHSRSHSYGKSLRTLGRETRAHRGWHSDTWVGEVTTSTQVSTLKGHREAGPWTYTEALEHMCGHGPAWDTGRSWTLLQSPSTPRSLSGLGRKWARVLGLSGALATPSDSGA